MAQLGNMHLVQFQGGEGAGVDGTAAFLLWWFSLIAILCFGCVSPAACGAPPGRLAGANRSGHKRKEYPALTAGVWPQYADRPLTSVLEASPSNQFAPGVDCDCAVLVVCDDRALG